MGILLINKYMNKLPAELRKAVFAQAWTLDGEGHPSRKPVTWQEVSEAVEMELESRADAATVTPGVDTAAGSDDTQGSAEAKAKSAVALS